MFPPGEIKEFKIASIAKPYYSDRTIYTCFVSYECGESQILHLDANQFIQHFKKQMENDNISPNICSQILLDASANGKQHQEGNK